MIKTLLIDDEPLASALVEEYLEEHNDISVIGTCRDGFEGMKAIMAHQPDLVFLDVQMPKINGFELLELLEDPPAIIFTTAFDEYALQAFEANAVDYLLKPFSKVRFDTALARFRDQQHVQKENTRQLSESLPPATEHRIVLKDAGKIRILPLAEVIRLEADGDYVRIITLQGTFMKKKTLSHFEQSLPARSFVRVHRSHLLHITHLTRLDAYEKNNHLARLKSGETIPVSRSGYQKLKAVLHL